MWEQLPELVLTQVFSYLGRTDRASAAQVCRHWNQVVSSPCLWRNFIIYIDRDLRNEPSVTTSLAVNFFILLGYEISTV